MELVIPKGYKPVVFFFLGTTDGGYLENRDISNYDNISSLSRQYIFFSHTFMFCKLKQVKNKISVTDIFIISVETIMHYLIFGEFFLFQTELLYF